MLSARRTAKTTSYQHSRVRGDRQKIAVYQSGAAVAASQHKDLCCYSCRFCQSGQQRRCAQTLTLSLCHQRCTARAAGVRKFYTFCFLTNSLFNN